LILKYTKSKKLEHFGNYEDECGIPLNQFVVQFGHFVKKFDQTYRDKDSYPNNDLKELVPLFENVLTHLLISTPDNFDKLGYSDFFTNHLIFKAFFYKYFEMKPDSEVDFDYATTTRELKSIALDGLDVVNVYDPGLRKLFANYSLPTTITLQEKNNAHINIATPEFKSLMDEPFLVLPIFIPKEMVRLTPSCALSDEFPEGLPVINYVNPN
jgi:hypothetical protein